MKEAAGDLNMTVVIVFIVAGLVAFFSMVIGPLITDGIRNEANCSDAICKKGDCQEGKCDCVYVKKNGKREQITCPYKG